MKKISITSYQEYLNSSIRDELKVTENILDNLLVENSIDKDKFNDSLKLYQEDDDILGCINSSEFEASKGLLPKIDACEEVLEFEIEF